MFTVLGNMMRSMVLWFRVKTDKWPYFCVSFASTIFPDVSLLEICHIHFALTYVCRCFEMAPPLRRKKNRVTAKWCNIYIYIYIYTHIILVRTSQETHYASATKPHRSMLFGETVAVYWANHTEHTNTLCGQKTQSVPHRKHNTSPLQSPIG
jgi:hypothetical protein